MKNVLVIIVVSLVAGAIGFVVPRFLLNGEKQSATSEVDDAETESGSMEPRYISFGTAIVNLNEERLNRYLRVTITFMVKAKDEEVVKTELDTKKAILMNWLNSYLTDKSLEEVRGQAGYTRARREIQDQFNELLFSDGIDRIQEVLFQEFTVQ